MLLAFGYTTPRIYSEYIRKQNRYERTQSVTQVIEGLGWEPLEIWRLHARLLEKFRAASCQSGTDRILY
jgi:hypothetical protein